MFIKISRRQCEQITKARQDLRLTQLELSSRAHVSLRTIQNLESGRRTSYTETTILSLIKPLNLDFEELLNFKESPSKTDSNSDPPLVTDLNTWPPPSNGNSNPSRGLGDFEPMPPRPHVYTAVLNPLIKQNRRIISSPILWVVLIILGISAILLIILTDTLHKTPNYSSKDWILKEHLGAFEVVGTLLGANNKHQAVINYIEMKRSVRPHEKIPVIFKWCWDYRPNGRPMIYISAFTEWDPEREIRLFDGVIQGVGNDIRQFEITSPKKPGAYRMRIFYASAFGQIRSFYGWPPEGMMESPSSAPCCEMTIEVVKRN
jgi:DNA-binding XRE family transcriptional regulator